MAHINCGTGQSLDPFFVENGGIVGESLVIMATVGFEIFVNSNCRL